MSVEWNEAAIEYLLDVRICPRCGHTIAGGVCARCGLDLRGETGTRLWAATNDAVAAIRRRQQVIEGAGSAVAVTGAAVTGVAVTTVPAAVPSSPRSDTASAPASASAPTHLDDRGPGRASALAPQRGPAMAPAPSGARAEWSVQSLLAIAGAGLVAVAAIVFAFFNPDLADPALRLAIIGPVTLLFGTGAVLTAKRLRLTAESLAALSAVFLGLDVQFVAELAPDGAATWATAGIGLLAAGAVLLSLGAATGLRAWLLGGTAAMVAFAPVLAGAAEDWSVTRWGLVAIGAVVVGIHVLLDRIGVRRDARLRAERVIATIAQLTGLVVVAGGAVEIFAGDAAAALVVALQIAIGAVLALVSARWIMPRAMSAIAGAALVCAAMVAGFSQGSVGIDAWFLPIVAAAIGAVLVVLAALARWGAWRRVPFNGVVEASLRVATSASTFVFAAPLVLATASFTVFSGIVPRFGVGADDVSAFALGSTLLVLAIAVTVTRIIRRPSSSAVLDGIGAVIPWLVAPAIAVMTLWEGVDTPVRAAAAVVVAAVIGAIVGHERIRARAGASLLVAAAVLAHGLLLAALLVVVDDRWAVELVGLAVIAALVLVARLVPSRARAFHWGAGNTIALGVLAIWLERFALEPIDRLAIVAATGALIAIVATLVRPIPRGAWWAILIVTIVPFLIAVGSVIAERTGWTALSTGTMAVLAVVIVLAHRPGTISALRVAAAAIVVPSIAVTVVCLGAQVLLTSGSPVVLPIIAVLVAAVLATASWIETALRRRGIEPAGAITVAIEASAGLTGAIAVLLALVRIASGLDTAMVVLIVIGVGAAVARVLGRRRWGWWVAAAAWTGALWCALLLSSVDLLEPYVLPPTVAAVVVGAVLTAFGRSGRMPNALVAAGLGAALLPTLLALVVIGSGTGASDAAPSAPWRAIGLASVSVAFQCIAFGLRGAPDRFHVLRRPLLIAAMVAAVGPGVQAARWGMGADAIPDSVVPMAFALPTAIVAAVLVGLAGRALASTVPAPIAGFDRRRWLAVPSLVLLVVGPVCAVRGDWASIWAAWGLMAALFALGVLTAVRTARAPSADAAAVGTLLPPVWTITVAGWVAAVGGWSERELRVEVFSIPMGAAVLAMGVIHLLARGADGPALPGRSVHAWPAGFAGSWWLLGPGILLILVPSVLSTGTDPVTWRAIMVIALALVSILVGSIAKLAAPFFIGLAVLPIENVVVFAVQIGKGVESLPWWITLATAGAVLLAIAMNAERRSAAGAKVSRIKEMR
jgi:hypothetical protein